MIPVNERVCYCGSQEVESEAHLLFKCTKYQHLREAWLNGLQVPDNFLDLDKNENFNLALNKPENIKCTARFLSDGKSLLYLGQSVCRLVCRSVGWSVGRSVGLSSERDLP